MPLLLSILTTIATYILFFAVLVFCHELGHFLFAKLFRMRVEEFALGMGLPKLRIGFDGETEYTLRAIPIGGFVRIAGMEVEDAYERKLTGAGDRRDRELTNVETMHQEAEEVAGVDPNGFNSRPIYQRFLVILAGPVFSFLAGYLAFCLTFLLFGYTSGITNQIDQVTQGSPAAIAGIRQGDTILAVDGHKVQNGDELIHEIRATGGGPIRIVLRTGSDPHALTQTVTIQKPNMITEDGKTFPQIGVTPRPSDQRKSVSLGQSFVLGGRFVAMYFTMLKKIVLNGQLKQSISGPIKTFSYVSQAQRQQGSEGVLEIFGQISLSLGLFNLFPIPILDGGHLALMALEAIRRRKLNADQTQVVFATGFAILVMLFLYVSFKDVFLR